VESIKDIGRRDFFRSFAKVAGIAAMAAGGVTMKPAAADAFFFGPKIDPRWKGLVANLKEYITRTYVKYDMTKASAALQNLAPYGITEQDVTPLQNVNRCLLPRDMFLTHYYVGSTAAVPSIKLFNISSRGSFDGFMVDGYRRTTLFGKKLDPYERVLLGEEIFSTLDIPPVAMPYNLAAPGSTRPEWVIAIPYGWIHDLYGRQSSGIEERLVEELTIHEITHIVHQTREELLPFLAQFGYRMDEEQPVGSISDIVAYLRVKPVTFHQAERLILERIYDVDSYYGDTGNVAHLIALRQIRDGILRLAVEMNRTDPKYPSNILKFSDQQCYACMAYLYNRAADQFALRKNQFSEPFAA
jgi:hypothetical protein